MPTPVPPLTKFSLSGLWVPKFSMVSVVTVLLTTFTSHNFFPVLTSRDIRRASTVPMNN